MDITKNHKMQSGAKNIGEKGSNMYVRTIGGMHSKTSILCSSKKA
jgi:hypothetical protein